MPRLLIVLFIAAALILALIIASPSLIQLFSPQVTPIINSIPTETVSPTPLPTPTPVPIEELRSKSVINEDVPFVVQAPLGEWSDPRQQDACEEAAVLMAIKWARGEQVGTPTEQRDEILEIAEWQNQNYGDSRDTSAVDTINRIANGYYNFSNATLKQDIIADDIIRELHNGNLVITPMNGQLMNNPSFTPPGPERHMVLIIGYNAETNEFITNDAGVSPGKNYRYPVDVFYNAIRDYETGYHIPIDGEKKNMIVIQK